jgi:DDE superfamily endonuclease
MNHNFKNMYGDAARSLMCNAEDGSSSNSNDDYSSSDDEANNRNQQRRHFIMAMVALCDAARDGEPERFHDLLSQEARRRRDRRIPRIALLHPSASPWARVLEHGTDQAMITLTGFDHASFNALHEMFQPIFLTHSPHSSDGVIRRIRPETSFRRGRPRMITSAACLGLVLVYGRTTGVVFLLCSVFGLTHTPLSMWLRFGRRVLLHVLKDHELARVKMPNVEKVAEYKAAIGRLYKRLKDVYSVGDGLKVLIGACGDGMIQEMFYNGWTHGHYITNVFIFAPDGTIIACILNCPGCMHDSELAGLGNIYTKLRQTYEATGGKCVMDSAFAARGNDFIIKSVQNHHHANGSCEYARLREATAVRQAAEWGMRALQGSFPRLKVPLRYEEFSERLLILQLVVLMFNWRANTVGINQIRTVFVDSWEHDTDLFVDSIA